MDHDESRHIPGEVFHAQVRKVYAGETGWAVNKRSEHMARVLSEAPHENAAETGDRRGHGKDFAKWIAMTTVERFGRESTTTLVAGDAHLVKLGQGHCGVAGPAGARFVAFAIRA